MAADAALNEAVVGEAVEAPVATVAGAAAKTRVRSGVSCRKEARSRRDQVVGRADADEA